MKSAIAVTYADIRTVRTRKVFQIVFEGPIEQMGAAMELFGPPLPDAEVWAGVARLKARPQIEAEANEPESEDNVGPRPPKALAQRAAILGTLQPFRRFLSETGGVDIIGPDEAAVEIKRRCGITSRKELDSNEIAARHFRNICTDYDNWMRDAA